jgi:hypothetical protein
MRRPRFFAPSVISLIFNRLEGIQESFAGDRTRLSPQCTAVSRKLARRAVELGDNGTNDLLVSEVLRTNELQVWFLSEHLVDVPLISATA